MEIKVYIVVLMSCIVPAVFTSDLTASRKAREGEQNTHKDPKTQPKASDFYLLDNCHRTILYYYYYDNKDDYIPVVSSIKLHLARTIAFGQYVQFKCYATIVAATPDHRLMLHFNKININSKLQPYLHERLHIFDGTTRKDLTPFVGLFGNYSNEKTAPPDKRLTDYVSLGSTLIIYFEGIPKYSSFEAIVTSFQDPFNNATCPPGYFLCKSSQFCIPASLQCDGLPNCGSLDQSDEQECFYDGSNDSEYSRKFDAENIGLMVGSSVSLLILMIVIIWFSIICIKRAIMKRDLHRLLRSMAPPAAPDPNRVYISPYAAMAMLSPPPLYTESTDPEVGLPPMELPPPYWSEAFASADTEHLIPSDNVANNNADSQQNSQRQNTSVNAAQSADSGSAPLAPQRAENEEAARNIASNVQSVGFIGNVNNGLPPYTSSDDLPTYAAATAAVAENNASAENQNKEEEVDGNKDSGEPEEVQSSRITRPIEMELAVHRSCLRDEGSDGGMESVKKEGEE